MNNNPRDIIIQLASLGALYLSISFLLVLSFGLINVTQTISTDSYWEIEGAIDSIRLGIAMVIVFFPTYIILTRLIYRYRKDDQVSYLSVVLWLVSLSLLVGGFVLLIALVISLYTFLSGDITVRFILKSGVVSIITLLSFYFYLKDLNNYWVKHPIRLKYWGIGVSSLVIIIVTLGFLNIETPAQIREMKLDEQQVNDLRNIQQEIENYLQTSSTTPNSLIEIYGDEELIPVAPAEREAYSYYLTAIGFNLCATFSVDTILADKFDYPKFVDINSRIKSSENWKYKAGRYCFAREIR